ncbi:MAG: Amidase, partial [Chloroflexi bacterium]|nr:Amidase [Chloroflexota bacterium]
MSNVGTLTISELAPRIERREVSPVEVTREILDRIETVGGPINAFITVDADRALAEARAAEDEIAGGHYRGPLHGIPLGIKDNIAVAGWPTTNGSALMRNRVTDFDAAAVERFRAAGAVIVGKTTLHEWAMGGTCSNHFYGTTHNPWDQTRVPGGSSGGSAAAVSASLIYGSIGTDGYGSIRTPSSYCGVVGYKPTYGLVSRFGELPAASSTSDHIGPIAKSVRDAALLLNVIAGYDSRDPMSLHSESRDYTEKLDRGVKGLKIGVPKSYFFERALPE